WDKQHECASIIDMDFYFTESTRGSFVYWPSTEPTQGRFYFWYIIKTVVTQHILLCLIIAKKATLR
ncbi:MAG: hypothetical protein KAV87_34695, partial [Desulfobacteraceae bacterium]|nr:hypothetical protein [Desulfobacteraceae bacterium]